MKIVVIVVEFIVFCSLFAVALDGAKASGNDVVSLKQTVLGRVEQDRVRCKFSPDGRKLAAFTSDKTYVFDLGDRSGETTVLNASPFSGELLFSKDNSRIIIWQFANPDGFGVSHRPITLREFDTCTGKRLKKVQLPYPDNKNSPEVTGAYWMSRQQFVVAYNLMHPSAEHYERTVILHDLAKNEMTRKWVWRAPYFRLTHFRPEPCALVAFDDKEGMYLWDLEHNRQLSSFRIRRRLDFDFACLAPGGKYIAIGGVEYTGASIRDIYEVTVWQIDREHRKREVNRLRVTRGWNRHRVYLSPDGNYLFVGEKDLVRTWQVTSAKERKDLLLKHPGFKHLAVHGNKVCTVGGANREVRLWQIGDSELADAKPPLTFSIQSRKKKVVRCEPVQLNLVVANETKQPIETTLPLAALECIHVQYEDGPFEKWRRGWLEPGCILDWPTVTIQPGGTREYPVELIWQKDYPVFDRVGKYRIKADWRGTVGRYAAYCNVDVEEGSEREKLCFSRLRRENLLGWLGLGSDYVISLEIARKQRPAWRADLARLFRIAKEYSDTRYGKYCLCTVLNTIDSTYLRKAKAAPIDGEFKGEVVRWAEQRSAQQTDARTLYSYASHLYRRDGSFRASLDLAQELLGNARTLEPDVVLKKRIEKLGFKALIDLRDK